MADSAQPARFTGAVLGAPPGAQYRLGRMIGEGGMGSVYEASELSTPGAVPSLAVKILHEEMAQNAIVVERFLGEGDLCRRLHHRGILRVFDVGNQNGAPYLVMELLQGRALVEYTEHQQRLPLNFAVTVCAGVLEALEYAHAQSVIHRDLKPENVFLVPSEDGVGYQTKLLDFGIAKSIDAAGGGRKKTATGVLLGTPGYMSPEQVKGAAKVDHRADLWAVGVMFYEMVAGATAFPPDGDDPNNVWGLISAVLTKEPLPLSLYDKHLAPFDSFIARALAKDIDKRHVTAREMSDDLVRIARADLQATAHAGAPGPFTHERSAVAINSHGELAAIPAVQIATAHAARDGANESELHRTIPSGEIASGVDGTRPAPTGYQASIAATAYAPPQAIGSHAPAYGVGVASHAAAAIAATAYAPPAIAAARAAQASGVAATAFAPGPSGVHGTAPFSGTSPSGYQPLVAPTPQRPNAQPAPFIPPNNGAIAPAPSGDGDDVESNVGLWIGIGAALIVTLLGALYWATH